MKGDFPPLGQDVGVHERLGSSAFQASRRVPLSPLFAGPALMTFGVRDTPTLSEADAALYPGFTFGLVADTHGVVGEDVLELLSSADLVLHAGDIGDGKGPDKERRKPGKRLSAARVLDRLRGAAGEGSVIGVLGNVDESEAEVLGDRGVARCCVVRLLSTGDSEGDDRPPRSSLPCLLLQHFPPGDDSFPSELVDRFLPRVLVYGHSHKPLAKVDAATGALCINPGSAGPRRFKLPRCLAKLRFGGRGRWDVTFHGLGDTQAFELPEPLSVTFPTSLTPSASKGETNKAGSASEHERSPSNTKRIRRQ